MTRYLALIALAYSSLLTGSAVFARPQLSDFHSTSLDLYALDKLPEGDRFAVEVNREDELYDRNGLLLGVKSFDVIMQFDVTPEGDVTLNGKPVPMGITPVFMEAVTITKSTELGEIIMSSEALDDAFDVGVVGVDIMAVRQSIPNPLNPTEGPIERIMIAESVFEINGSPVKQTGLGRGNSDMEVFDDDDEIFDDFEDVTEVGQVLDVYPDGTIIRQPACSKHVAYIVQSVLDGVLESDEAAAVVLDSKAGVEAVAAKKAGVFGAFCKWFKNLSVGLRAVYCSLVSLGLLAGIFASVLLASRLMKTRYTKVIIVDIERDENKAVAKMDMSEKKAALASFEEENQEDNLPEYEPGYNRVETF